MKGGTRMEKQVLKMGGDIFEITDRVERGYMIWNIGRNMTDGYLPLCRLEKNQPFKGGRSIEKDTLKCIPVPEAQTILAAIGYGPNTPAEMRRYIERYGNSRDGWRQRVVLKMKRALPIMEELVWE